MKQMWIIQPSGRNSTEYSSKSEAYRMCRTMNGTKSGGKKPYHVQRKHVRMPA